MKYFELLNEAFTKRLGQGSTNEIDTTDFKFDIEPFYSAGKMMGVKLIITKPIHKYKLAKLIEKNDEEKHPFDYKEKWIVEYDIAGNLFSAVLPETYGKGDTIWTPFHLREEEVADVLHLDMNKFKKMFSMVGPKRDAKEIKDTKLIPTEKLMEDDGDEFDNIQVSDEPAELDVVDTKLLRHRLATRFATNLFNDFVVIDNVVFHIRTGVEIVDDRPGSRWGDKLFINYGVYMVYVFKDDIIEVHGPRAAHATEVDKIGRVEPEYFFGVKREDQVTYRTAKFDSIYYLKDMINDSRYIDHGLSIEGWRELDDLWESPKQLTESASAGDIKLRKFLFAKTPRDNKKFPNQAGYYNRELQGYLIVWDYNYNIHTGQSEDLALSHKEMRKKLPYDLQEILIDGHGSSWGREDYYKTHIGFFVSDGMDPKDEAILRRIMSHEDKQKD